MVCNICGQAEATIHLTEIMNDQMVEIHLCEACAEQKGADFKIHFDFNKLLANLADLGGEEKLDHATKLVCKSCGMTQEEFGRTGRFGCAECYHIFARLLMPILKRIQRDTRHTGKVPKNVSAPVKRSVNLRDLYERLKKSVAEEAFEEAAQIRDQIRELELKMKKENKKTKKNGE